MTSFRQIEANRRNALKSTGPKTYNGKRASRRNALRHGLTAETVIEGLEDTEDYRAFEAAIISDYDAQTAVKRELVLRLASLLWRMRRAISIETDLFQIQVEILRDRKNEFRQKQHHMSDGTDRDVGKPGIDNDTQEQPDPRHEQVDSWNESAAWVPRAITYCFLRLGNVDNGAFERLGRYNALLWRQAAQTLLLLQSTRRR
jgi:hypothetical protein